MKITTNGGFVRYVGGFQANPIRTNELKGPLVPSAKIAWFNEDTAAHGAWHYQEFRKEHGKIADMVVYGYQWNSNFTAHIGVGTNRSAVEFGLRDDGVLVWRKVK